MSEERLRIPLPNASSTRPGHTSRRIAFWVLMIAAYSGLYFITRDDPPMNYAFWGLMAFLVVFVVVGMIRFRGQVARFHRDVGDGIAALARGDLDRAHDTFWNWAERAKVPTMAALANHNLAWTLMRQGKLQHAIAIATENDEFHPGALTAITLYPTSAVDLALYHALLGALDAAEQWMVKTEQRSHLPSQPSLAAMKVFVRAVLDCRAGRPDDAARQLADRWADHEAMLAGETLRPMRIVRAFAIAAGGPRNAGMAETLVALSRPAYPGEYDFLGVDWPEMASFLGSHGLSRKPTTDDRSAAS